MRIAEHRRRWWRRNWKRMYPDEGARVEAAQRRAWLVRAVAQLVVAAAAVAAVLGLWWRFVLR